MAPSPRTECARPADCIPTHLYQPPVPHTQLWRSSVSTEPIAARIIVSIPPSIVRDNVQQDGDSGWRLNCPAPLLSFGIGECIVGPFCTWLQSCRQVDLSRDAREAGWLREGGGAGAESLPVSRRSSIANVNPHGSRIREARRRRSWDWGMYGEHEGKLRRT